MKDKLNKIVTRVDRHGMRESENDTILEWYEYALATQLIEERISDDEFDKLIDIRDYNKILSVLRSYSEVWEYDFIDENNKSILWG